MVDGGRGVEILRVELRTDRSEQGWIIQDVAESPEAEFVRVTVYTRKVSLASMWTMEGT